MSYVRLEEIEPAYLESCGNGLFQSNSADVFGNTIVTTDGEDRYAVYLNNPKGPSYVKLDTNLRGSRTGVLWPTPAIEIDPATQYDYERQGGALGDIVIVDGRAAIIAISSGQIFDDPSDIPLWTPVRPTKTRSIGFKSWHLISVASDGDRRAIYTHPNPVSQQLV